MADKTYKLTFAMTDGTSKDVQFTSPQGPTGSRGNSILKVTTAPSSYTTAVGGFTPTYRIALSTVKSQSKATEVLVGDTIAYSYYQYPVGYVNTSYVYLGARNSIRGATGAAGAAGAAGADGYTPVKGVDYYTAADQESIVQQVIAALGTPVWGQVDSDNNIILTGDLAEGTYTFKYEDEDGNVTVIGTLTSAAAPTYTNLFVPDTASLNTRMSGSSSTSKAANGYVMTAVISIPETAIAGTTAGSSYIAVPAGMWANSASVFTMKNGDVYGYMDAGSSAGTTEGEWTKIYLRDQWGQTYTTDGVIVSLYVSDSAITTSDIQNIQIYFNECPA